MAPGGTKDFFDVVTTPRAIRRLKPEPIPDAVLRQIMDAAICAPSGGNRQGWSFLVIRDAAKQARVGELYREAWEELLGIPAEVETAALIPWATPSGSSGARRAGRSPKWRTPTARARRSAPEDHGAVPSSSAATPSPC